MCRVEPSSRVTSASSTSSTSPGRATMGARSSRSAGGVPMTSRSRSMVASATWCSSSRASSQLASMPHSSVGGVRVTPPILPSAPAAHTAGRTWCRSRSGRVARATSDSIDPDVPAAPRRAMTSQSSVAATGADHLVAALQDLGVETVFGLPGVHNLAVWEAAAAAGLRVVGVRHEQAAVYAADGYARATGRLGVAVVTTGPGAANTLGATGEAMSSGAPVLVVATDIPSTLRRPGVYRGVLHETRDQAALFAPVTKATVVTSAAGELYADTVPAGPAPPPPPPGPGPPRLPPGPPRA